MLLFSGGIDSTTVLYLMQDRIDYAVIFNYGQAAFPRLKKLAQYHTKKVGVRLLIEKVDVPITKYTKPLFVKGGKPERGWHRNSVIDMDEETTAEYLKKDFRYIEGRNMTIYSRFIGKAVELGKNFLFTGNQLNYDELISHFFEAEVSLDNGPGFTNKVNDLIPFAFSPNSDVRIMNPLVEMALDKSDIITLGKRLGVDFKKTQSCEYEPVCGKCSQCKERNDLLK